VPIAIGERKVVQYQLNKPFQDVKPGKQFKKYVDMYDKKLYKCIVNKCAQKGSMKTKKSNLPGDAHKLYVNLQKIFRSLSFGRGLRGAIPTLTGTQMRLLSFFNEKDIVYISEISRVLGMSMQSVNNLVARLETLGYVQRSKNKTDKRLSDIQLTAKGREGFNAFRDEQFKTLTEILDQLETAERNILSATIENAALILEKAAVKASQGKAVT